MTKVLKVQDQLTSHTHRDLAFFEFSNFLSLGLFLRCFAVFNVVTFCFVSYFQRKNILRITLPSSVPACWTGVYVARVITAVHLSFIFFLK